MASQTPSTPQNKPVKKDSETSRKGNKSTFQYIGIIVILVITVVAFVFVPSTAGGSSSTNMQFGSFDGQAITYTQNTNNYFAKQVQNYNEAMKQQGLNDQNYQFFAYQVWRQAFESTVTHVAMIDTVKKAGFGLSETFLDDKMAENAAFQENGKFSPRLYRETTMSAKLAVRDSIREDSYISQYTDDIYALKPSSKEIAFIKDIAKDLRTVEYAAVPLANYPDSEVSAWANNNGKLFRRLKLSRITLTTSEADAQKLLKQIKGDTLAFDEAAKSHSTDTYASQGGSMGLRYVYDIQSELDKKDDVEALAALKAGEVSAIYKTTTGSWAFFKAESAAIQADLADPAVLRDVRSYMLRSERGKLEDWAMAEAKLISTAPAADFEALCKKKSLATASVGPFPLNYGDVDFAAYGQRIPLFKQVNTGSDPLLEQVSTNEAFLTAAFSLAPGSVSQPFVLGNSVLVIKVKEQSTATEDELATLSLYYPYFFQQKTTAEINELFLKSPLLKDNFSTMFFKYVMPKQS